MNEKKVSRVRDEDVQMLAGAVILRSGMDQRLYSKSLLVLLIKNCLLEMYLFILID